VLRRGDGEALQTEVALARQGVRDGDVLYLVPGHLAWPEPAYDDVVEEIAAGARARGRVWDTTATRTVALGAAAVVLLTGLAALVRADRPVAGAAATSAALVLLVIAGLIARALGDGVTGTAAGAFALPYAGAAGALFVPGDVGAGQVLVGAAALTLASAAGAVAVGCGLRVFVAGATIGALAATGGLLASVLSGAGAASILVVAIAAGIGLAPALAARLGRLPLPVVTADPEVIASEGRADPAMVRAAVARADETLAGMTAALALVGAGSIAMLSTTTGAAGRLLGALAAVALLLRARSFPTVAVRLPLIMAGLAGLAVTAWVNLSIASAVTGLVGLVTASASVVVLLATAATARRRSERGTPYLSRVVDIVDVTVVVALAPVACAVLGLYGWARGLTG
jgi:type VII secretion integral membrane protein EccD